MSNKIKNFSIIAHIDHGKSTLADRMIELTKTVEDRKMKNQILDKMDIERERGITIKLQPVTMNYKNFIVNLIDTPGHVDFSYEVSRSLAAVESVVLLVDATQGIQAQTLANLYLAIEQDLVIIPVINKIDLPASDIPRVTKEIINLLGCNENEIIKCSAKTGFGVDKVMDAVINKTPSPKMRTEKPLRALVFDSNYDEYKGVVAYVRVVDGTIKKGDKIGFMSAKSSSDAIEVGIFTPEYKQTEELFSGEIGYIITGFKDVSECSVGDTISLQKDLGKIEQLQGYKETKPMVFAGIFPREGNDLKMVRDTMDKLKLNDASLVYESEFSEALGFGFRCGFLGLLHLEIVVERLKREYNLELIVTVPSVVYYLYKKNGEKIIARTPQAFLDPVMIDKIEEPWVTLDIMVPQEYIGKVMELTQSKKGEYKNTEYIEGGRVILHYNIPLVSILTDFYDKVKSVTSGYASMNYEYSEYRQADVVKMDILIAEEPIEALSTIVYREDAFQQGREIVKILKNTLTRQMFVVKIQASIQGKVIAAERLSARRKDVTAKLYGGDVSRKRKLLDKQKKGKKKMMAMGKGSINIPPDTFIKILRK